MPNFVNSVGYRLEKLHSGMIAYLCDLWVVGNRTPLEVFMSCLGIELDAQSLTAKREYKSIDLVIFDAHEQPLIAIEMKVDNHESRIKRKNVSEAKDWQTRIYPQLVEGCEHFLFVTLGLGEYYHAPYGEQFCWVRIEKFLRALEAIPSGDPFIDAWREAVWTEKRFQDKCRDNDLSGVKEHQVKTWNVYFLGFLKERLERLLSDKLEAGLAAYPYSSDTILNFGLLPRSPCYMEINSNGKLNLKVKFEGYSSESEKRKVLERAQSYYDERLSSLGKSELKSIEGSLKKTRTIVSFDVGLAKREEPRGFFEYARDENETCKRIVTLIDQFYGKLQGPDP